MLRPIKVSLDLKITQAIVVATAQVIITKTTQEPQYYQPTRITLITHHRTSFNSHHIYNHTPTSISTKPSWLANAVHLAELTRVFRGSTSSTMDAAHQQLMSYNHMPVSGLNLNLGGALVHPPPPPPTVSLEDACWKCGNGEMHGLGWILAILLIRSYRF
ncbi:unnamed protein product [Eruca vesicaria subsp. sativa]|uniref:Uncharacterized protein n=1 Tax=Eruca vesicaria subsp. sativa TaxID=29727 RepID=A0ABC8JMK9_ERUVS|nr:unnamed protein product [Eruca vesicaria subsp. sativa]